MSNTLLYFLVWLTITSTAVIVGFFDLIGSGGQ